MNNVRKNLITRIPGFLYLLLAITGFYTAYAMGQFASQIDVSQWFSLLIQKEFLYQSGLFSFFLMNIVWMLLAYSFYERFKFYHRTFSSQIVLFVIAGSMVVFVLILLQSVPLFVMAYKSLLPSEEFQLWIDQAYFIFMVSMKGNRAAYIFYALWLFPLAALFSRLPSISKIVRIILSLSLFVAGIGYLSDFLLFYLFPEHVMISITEFTFIGEVVVLVWLLVRGQSIQSKEHSV